MEDPQPRRITGYQHKNLALTAGILLLSIVVFAQQEAYESPAGTKFLLYTPPGYSSSTTAFPLLLSLHSKGEVGDDLTELTSKNPEEMPSRLIYLNRWPQDLPFIVLTPQLRPEEGDPDPQWGPQWPPELIDEVVRYVTANFRVDLQRIYVTGMSKGGIGTWTYASAHPDKIAAIIPISGRSDLTKACAVKNIPIWVFHGDGDDLVTPEYSIDMVSAIKACQPPGVYKPHLNILHARNHNGWNEVYNGSSGYKIYEWLLKFRKGDTSNKKPYVNAGPDLRIKMRNDPLHIIGDFFDSDGEITNVIWKQTGGTPLTLSNTGSELLKLSGLTTGLFEFELTVTDDKGGQSSDKVALEITDSSATPSITQLVLFNGKTDAEIGNLSEGQIINKTALNLTEINIKAITSEGTASIKFSVNTDRNTRTQNNGPYFIKNQTTTTPEWQIGNGTYLICATPYAQTSASGNPGVSQCYKITFTEGTNPESCAGNGKIQQELWTGISGNTVSSIDVNKTTASITDLTLFEGPANIGDNYGRRIRGYICVPVSGTYIFWISSNDNSELWLSTNADAANRKKVAYVSGYTNVREWGKYTTQESAAISLVANQKYYIEALHKEGVGTDHVAVGWQLPAGTLERPIPAMRLIPFTDSGTSPVPVVSITSPSDGQTFTAPATVNINATASVSGGSITKVEFYNGTVKLGEDATSPYSFAWNNVPAGTYTVTAKAIATDGKSNSASVGIVVTSSAGCAGAGKIQQELWTGVSGTSISSIPVAQAPASVTDVTIFEGPANISDNYGRRIRGYICAPVTGTYVFWIASNDNSEVWLSTDASVANKRKIAYVSGYTNVRQWDKYTSQKSVGISLVANQKYYIEALHKEGVGTDHVAVGWQLPGGTQEMPIPGIRLIPFTDSGTSPVPVVSITSPSDGQTFTALASVYITTNASVSGGTITKVEFYNGTVKLGEDVTSPYSFAWNNVPAGNYTLTAKAIDNGGGSATASIGIIVTSGSSACSATGTILREVWTGIQYNDVGSIPVHESPDGTSGLTIFEDPTNVGDNYGTRVSGYLCVPVTGAYTFWISSNDGSELWLSTDANPSTKRRIAWVTGYTNVREWTKYASQKSAAINLVAGQRFYIEALHKEGVGSDHMAVGWQLPNGTLERPIPGNRLSPSEEQNMTTFQTTGTSRQKTDVESDSVKHKSKDIYLFPNPVPSGWTRITLYVKQERDDYVEKTIEIIGMKGEVVHVQNIVTSRSLDDGPTIINIEKELKPGFYVINVISNGRRSSSRLLVK
ncbi:MAG: Ig-like domain-containing protein [Cyclobacteriaceae bacterium]